MWVKGAEDLKSYKSRASWPKGQDISEGIEVP